MLEFGDFRCENERKVSLRADEIGVAIHEKIHTLKKREKAPALAEGVWGRVFCVSKKVNPRKNSVIASLAKASRGGTSEAVFA